MPDLLPLIRELVGIDSVNPGLDSSRAGETEIAEFVANWSSERDLEVTWLEPVPHRPSVVIRAGGAGGGRTLMLNAHLDTVGVLGMSAPFEAIERDGRLYGRGVMDMKASLAACMVATEWAARQGLKGDVVLAAVADEEHDSIGTRAVLDEIGADAAIVTEPTDLDLHVVHRGFSVFEVEFVGKASHTSQPELGVNALTHLGRLLAAVERRDDELRSREPHPLLAHGSLQAVLARGGHELFTTPASAGATIERRTLPGEDAAVALAELEGLVADLARHDPSLRAQVRTLVAREPFEAAATSEIEESLANALLATTGRQPRRMGAPYWTDAALTAAAGIPTLLFGPSGGGIHQPGEWLDIDSARIVQQVLQRTIASFCA